MKSITNFYFDNTLISFLTLLLFSFFSTNLSSQIPLEAPQIEWENTIGSTQGEDLYAVEALENGNFLCAGYSNNLSNGDKNVPVLGAFDFWYMLLNPSGQIIWQKSGGGSSFDRANSALELDNGDLLVAGFSSSGISILGEKSEESRGENDYWLIRMDQSGNKIWDKTIGGSLEDRLSQVIETGSGNLFITGFSLSSTSGDKTGSLIGGWDYWCILIDSLGNIIWQKTIGGTADDFGRSAVNTADGGFLITGYSSSDSSSTKSEDSYGGIDGWVVKLDSLGNIEWDKTLGGNGDDYFLKVEDGPAGDFIISGYSNSGANGTRLDSTNGLFDIWLVRLSENGALIWDKSYGGNSNDWGYGLSRTSDGNLVVAGQSESGISGDKTEPGQGSRDYWMLKIAPNGSLIWEKTVGGNGLEYLAGADNIEATDDGGLILAGSSFSSASGDKSENAIGSADWWPVKLEGETIIAGCTDPSACNFNPSSTWDDGSCIFPGTTCDDGNPDTQNDFIQADCSCAGTPICANPFPSVEANSIETTFQGNGYQLSWDTVPNQIGCQVAVRFAGGNTLGQQIVAGANAQSFFVPGGFLQLGTDYEWRVRCGCSQFPIVAGPWSNWQPFTTPSGASITASPNPTEGFSQVTFSVQEPQQTTLEVIDMNGRVIEMLFSGMTNPNSEYRFEFDGSGLPNGVYIYRLTTSKEVVKEKILISK